MFYFSAPKINSLRRKSFFTAQSGKSGFKSSSASSKINLGINFRHGDRKKMPRFIYTSILTLRFSNTKNYKKFAYTFAKNGVLFVKKSVPIAFNRPLIVYLKKAKIKSKIARVNEP
jgi:hypothetical protein